MTLLCSICLFIREQPNEAVTVINGQAACEDHAGYVQGGDHAHALAAARRDEGDR